MTNAKLHPLAISELARVVGGNDVGAYRSIESQRPSGEFPPASNGIRDGVTPNLGGPRWENSPSGGGGGGGGGTPQRPKGGPPRNMSVPRIR